MRTCLLIVGVLAGALASAGAGSRGGPTDCDSLSSVAPFSEISYSRNIQSLFNANCMPCHFDGGSPGGLHLDAGLSLIELLAPQTPMQPRVIPRDPLASVLFLKVNCENPGSGSRMPQGSSALSLTQQALIFDWIRIGAPLMHSSFEDR